MQPNARVLLAIAFAVLGPPIMASGAQAIPVRDIPNLASITFWERTGGTGPTPFTFGVNSTQLTTRLADPLTTTNSDFGGVPGREFYDVFYSDANGLFNLNGEYLTIEGVFDVGLPSGGGLNLAEIGLNFAAAPTEFGNFVASFVALGNNASPGDVGNAIEGDLQTHTTMGNTIGQTERLRVTLGFLSSSGPPPRQVPEPTTLSSGRPPGQVPEPTALCLPAALCLLTSGIVALIVLTIVLRRKAVRK